MAARSTMAATNKSLAQMNKTQDVGKATKDGYKHARNPPPIGAFAAGTKARKKASPSHAHRRWITTIHRRQAKTWPARGVQATSYVRCRSTLAPLY